MSMSQAQDSVDTLLPHHVQQELCTSRLPYRQGRKLTAVKVYTINDESKHLLIFAVPSLNLRQETKALFLRCGKLLQFYVTNLPSEQFTETYHAVYEKIESARIAKKMLDTKNYYGGNLHVCYAPEFETIEDTREKLMLRQKHVSGRLRNLQKESSGTTQQDKTKSSDSEIITELTDQNVTVSNKMYMGNVNNIILDKRIAIETKSKKKLKCLDKGDAAKYSDSVKVTELDINTTPIEVIDCTSSSTDVITNIELNYDNFGQEIVKHVPYKPVNRIKFNKKS